MLYTIVRRCWSIVKWFWLMLIVTSLVGFFANLLVLKRSDLPDTIFATVLTPGPAQTALILVFGLLILATLLSRLLLLLEQNNASDHLVQRYLQEVIKANQGLNPSGFAQSQPLISVNVPLNDIFIHLRVYSDRPIYDIPGEQEKLLEELRQRSDLRDEEKEELIQRLRVTWYSQVGQVSENKKQKTSISVTDIFKYMNIESPVAVILGAPGSGKSTTLRWLSLHMARATLSSAYQFPRSDNADDDFEESDEEYYYYDSLRRIPILLKIGDYAKQLVNTADLSVEQFFTKQLAETFQAVPAIASRLLDEIKRGRGLILFDGLDEVASDSLRRQVAQNIDAFISAYSRSRQGTWNMFLVTSRIVGYESSTFSRCAHYTLLDFEDEQIKRFLARWCPAVERYQAMFAQNMKPLTPQQEAHVKQQGNDQYNQLLRAIFNNPSIKRLAVNPLMLTILALIQRSGKTLPHRRIELYQIVTRTLLDNWNKESGRRVFPVEEVVLAEQLLGNLAYQLHSTDPILTEQEVKVIAHRTMTEFYGYPPDYIKESDVTAFIEILRSSSGLFVETGQGLFNFMHRTFQEYFVALYLLRRTPAELKQFVTEHYHSSIWREPLLLAIAYKSGQSSRAEWLEASQLIKSIRDASDTYDTVLFHNLLFAASCIVDCSAWSIDKQLQQEIAEKLFELYGDIFGRGHYDRLRHEIAKVTLLWLRGQPQESSQTHTLPPLLSAFCHALCDTSHSERQQGAVQLLAELAPHLSSCPGAVLAAIVPPLQQLSDTTDLLKDDTRTGASQPALLQPVPYFQAACYAWEALDKIAPHGLHEQLPVAWERWQSDRAYALLEKHLFELNIPFSRVDGLHLYLLTRLAEAEAVGINMHEQGWQQCWHAILQKEMARGRFATFQLALTLRLLLAEEDETQQQWLANEFLLVLSAHNQQTVQMLIVIILSYFDLLERNLDERSEPKNWGTLGNRPSRRASSGQLRRPIRRTLSNSRTSYPDSNTPPQRRGLIRAWRPTVSRRLSGWGSRPLPRRRIPPRYLPPDPPVEPPFNNKPTLMQFLRRKRRVALRLLREWRADWPTWLPFSLQFQEERRYYEEEPDFEPSIYDQPFLAPRLATRQQQVWRAKLNLSDIPSWFHTEQPNMRRDWHELRALLKREKLIEALCDLLAGPLRTTMGIELLALHVVLATLGFIPPDLRKRVDESLQCYRTHTLDLTTAQRLTLDALTQRLSGVVGQRESPEMRAAILERIRKQSQLSKMQVELLLQATIDTGKLVEPRLSYNNTEADDDYDNYDDDYDYHIDYYSLSPRQPKYRIDEIAWDLVKKPFVLDAEAQQSVVQALENENVMICAGAALLLQKSKSLLPETRATATQTILHILADPLLARRRLDPPDGFDWRLDDILFETLQAMAEQAR